MTYDEKVAYLTGRGTLVITAEFDNTQWFTNRDRGDYGIFLNNSHGPNATLPVQDTTVKASGHASMRFAIDSQTGSGDGGAFFTNFSTGPNYPTQFGQNSEFWVQWQQRVGAFFATHTYDGGGGWKQCIIGAGDQTGCASAATYPCSGSCSPLETVTQNTNHRGMPQMYNSCVGSPSHPAFDGFNDQTNNNWNGLGPNYQNAYNDGSGTLCTYTPVVTAGNHSHCFYYYPDEFITYTVHIVTGARSNREFVNSHVDLYAARQGATTYSQLLNWGPYNLTASDNTINDPSDTHDLKFGKVWFLPYNTGKLETEVHQSDHTYYANLIVSTEQPPLTTDEVVPTARRTVYAVG